MMRRSLQVGKTCGWLYYANRIKLHSSAPHVLFSRFDKDLPSPKVLTPVSKLYGPDTDILLTELKMAKSVNRTLELISMHIDVMNSKHIIASLERIHYFVKDLEGSQNLQDEKTFQSLCSRLMKVIRLFEPFEVISAYKVLSSLQIRNNTYIMQSILKMVAAHLNNMTLGQLTFLNFILNKQRHNSLVDGLRLAIPLVVQVQIDQKLDSDNMQEVVNCFQLACTSKLKPSVIEKIMQVLLDKASVLTADSALTVAYSLLNLDSPVDGYKELLGAAFDILSSNIHELNISKVTGIFRICQSQRYYHTNFFFSAVDHIVSNKWNLASTYTAIIHATKLEFCPPKLLDYFVDLICSESTNFQTSHFYSPLSIVEFLTASSYHPSNVDEAARMLYSDESKLNNLILRQPNLIVKFLSCLAMLGHFPSDWLTKVLNEDFLHSSWSTSRKQGRGIEFERNLLSLSYGLEIYNKTEDFSIPSSILHKFVQGVHQRHVDGEYPLSTVIENGLGGSQFLQNGVFTHDGHVIDHIVVMRSGNYPVSLQSLKRKESQHLQHHIFAEDIVLPEDAKIIAVILAKQDCFCRDPEVLKGWMHLKVRHLAKKNYSPVVINYNQYKEMPDREKIPFLMREIKQAIQEDCLVTTTNYSKM